MAREFSGAERGSGTRGGLPPEAGPCRAEGKGYGPIEIRSTCFHRAKGRTKMLRLIGEEPERVVVAHGEVVRSDGAAFLRRAFAWLL